jgi:general secretion pathway protein D
MDYLFRNFQNFKNMRLTMRLKPYFATFLIATMAAITLAPTNLHAQKQGESITLNFVNAEIEAVARTMAVITGRNLVVDPRIKGTMNLSSEKPLSPLAAYNQFVTTLRLQGVVVVESQGIYKVVPEVDAKLITSVVTAGGAPAKAANNQIVTQIFNLNYDSAANLLPILRPLISPNNTINVNPSTNSLVITDYADNLQRIARIIAASDIPGATDVEIIPLKHALSSDLAPLVTRLVDSGGTAAVAGQADTSVKTTIISEPRSNALIVRTANAARLALVKSLVAKLDQPSSDNASGNVHVVFLKNADALKLAVTLRAALASESSSGASTGAGAIPRAPTSPAQSTAGASAAASTQASAQPSTGGQIQADPATNSLVITAAPPQYRQLRAIIDQLDSRRAQVYVEALIAEINSDKAAEFGIQWQNALGQRTDPNNLGAIGTNFGSGGKNLLALALSGLSTTATSTTAPSVLPAVGMNIGLGTIIAGKTVLGVFANFLQTTGEGNILSTPNLLTLDNEEAKIIIGQNVPFVTGQYTNSAASAGGASGTVNPFQTVERKDVGLTLKVKPQISENGTVKLQIYQEISSVQASSINSATGLITNKRSFETNVLVEDGGIIVLGGLLQDEYSGNQEKVPLLGDIPLLGNLFKTESRSRKKTNLMVFIRPVVVRDGAAAEQLSLDRYDLMRSGQQTAQPSYNFAVPINDSAVLPTQVLPVRPPAKSIQTVPLN